MNIAVLVRLFPNVVQTYVLNHILSIRKNADHATIIAELDPAQDEVHPAIDEQGLLDHVTYINITREMLLSELAALPWIRLQYYALLPRLAGCLKQPGMGLSYFVKALFRVRILLNDNIDVVHSHSLFSSYQYLFLKTCFNKPFVTTFHGLVPNTVSMLAPEKVRAVLAAGDAFIVNTRFAGQMLIDMGCKQERIHIIPQGTDTTEFAFRQHAISRDKPVILLTVGRLSPEKGHVLAIEAVEQLLVTYPDIEYHIVGHGESDAKLKRIVDEKNLQKHVIIHGLKTGRELKDIYHAAHIFILPSISGENYPAETQGVVLQEAQSSGVPVIASTTGGIPEVIHDGETGLLFIEGEVDQLAEHVRTLVEDPERYAALVRAGRTDIEKHYSTDAIYKRLRTVYESVLYQTRNT